MAIQEKDIVLRILDKDGDTIGKPITRLANVEADAEIKENPADNDYIPIIDTNDSEQMKKTPISAIKADIATQSAAGLMSADDKKKLDGVATNANKYTHPTTAGNKHIPSGGSSGQILRWSADGTAVWGNDNNTTYTPASENPKAAGTAAVGTSAKYAREDHVHPLQTSVSGNAGTATKFETSRTIDGVSFNGSANITHYGTCSTAAATAAKVVAVTGFVLKTGSEVTVKFTVTNTAANPTLNVNNTGAKAIYYRGAAIAAGYLAANRTYSFRYNGTQYDLVGDIDTNTTYAAATTTKNGLMSAADKKKLDGIEEEANKYTHPVYTARTGVPTANQTPIFGGTFSVSQPVSDTSGHITALNARTVKIPNTEASQSAAGLMSAADKKKLDGVAEGANKYTHPSASGNKHIPSGGSSGQILRWSADGTAVWDDESGGSLPDLSVFSDFKSKGGSNFTADDTNKKLSFSSGGASLSASKTISSLSFSDWVAMGYTYLKLTLGRSGATVTLKLGSVYQTSTPGLVVIDILNYTSTYDLTLTLSWTSSTGGGMAYIQDPVVSVSR